VTVERLGPEEARRRIGELADVLVDCVEGGASVSFMSPFSRAEGEEFFLKVVEAVERGERILLAAFMGDQVVGTVQVLTALPPNQPHRAELAKLLVARSARGAGAGRALMEFAEGEARAAGKTLLTLDTVTGSVAERLYERLGWNRAGVIPGYALMPDGAPAATTIFWKSIA
jgi:GNAT superfamily N-acetyltransferase